MFFSIIPKIAIFLTIFNISLFINKSEQFYLNNIIEFFGLFSIVIGSTMAVFQRKVKRLFAFSTISHSGFILLAL